MLEEIEETARVGYLVLILARLAGVHFGERLFRFFPVDLHDLQANVPSETHVHLSSPAYRDLDIAVPGEVKHRLGYAILVGRLRVGSRRGDELVLLLEDPVVEELVLLEVLCRT